MTTLGIFTSLCVWNYLELQVIPVCSLTLERAGVYTDAVVLWGV